MKIYIGHSKEYDYEQELYSYIREDKELKKHEIILPHEHSRNISNTRESYKEIDCFIAEVSYKATGLGIELGFAFDDQRPIYCIYKKGIKFSNSLRILTTEFFEYETKEEMLMIIKEIIHKMEK